MQNHPNYITFQDWVTLKTYCNLTYGYHNFNADEIDNVCVFYDEKEEYFDWVKNREFEEREPSYVLVPKFFWEAHKDTIPEEFMPQIRVQERLQQMEAYRKHYYELMTQREEAIYECDVIPRPEQVPLLDGLVEHFHENERIRGVVAAAPGFGKTISSIKTIYNLKAHGLIVVPNEVLNDQWLESIIKFSGCEAEDVAIIEGSDEHKIRNELHKKKIVIVKIQSLYSQVKRLSPDTLADIYSFIDVVIYDECHTSGAAEGYAKTSSIFNTPNIIGMSATPYRDGINDYLLKISIGETIYKSEHKNLIPDVQIYNLGIEFSPREIQRLAGVRGDYIMFLGIFNMILAGKQSYFDYLADWVNYNHSIGHKIVVLFSTNKMVERLKKTIETRHKHLISDKLLALKGDTKKDSLALVTQERKKLMEEYKAFKEEQDQRVKNKEIKRKEAQEIIKEYRANLDLKVQEMKDNALSLYKKKVKEADIISSNYNLLSAGFDKSELSNIIYGSPRVGKVSVIQSLGRITRIHEGKLHPLAQFMFPSVFLDFHNSTPFVLKKNIMIEYDTAKITYHGFEQRKQDE